jgi:uncharacterized protein YjgD (DUF1641 family)
MDHAEGIIERLEQIENKLTPMAENARVIGELREELAPRVNEAVHALIRELADVEADFQLEDLLYFIKKVLRNLKNLNFTLDQLKNLIDFAVNVEPLLKSTVPQVIFYLDDLERSGVFRMINTAIEVMKKIGANYSQEDLAQVGAGMVRMAEVLKKLAEPQSVAFLERAAGLPGRIDLAAVKPTGPIGLLLALSGKDAREGLGVLVELTKGLSALRMPAETVSAGPRV